jgi:hypothetical protein
MAHNHSNRERTVLWIIIPIAVGLTLLFVWRNHQLPSPKTPAGETAKVESPAH